MPSKNAVGIAPLVTGIALAGPSLRRLLATGLSPWTAVSFLGGCAAILVGIGVLLEWGDFGAENEEPARSATVVLAGIAVCSFAVGAALVVV